MPNRLKYEVEENSETGYLSKDDDDSMKLYRYSGVPIIWTDDGVVNTKQWIKIFTSATNPEQAKRNMAYRISQDWGWGSPEEICLDDSDLREYEQTHKKSNFQSSSSAHKSKSNQKNDEWRKKVKELSFVDWFPDKDEDEDDDDDDYDSDSSSTHRYSTNNSYWY